MSSPTPRSPRLAPELRRRQIIDATLRVAERRGYVALTVESIASEAGITRPVIYDLFGELDGLLRATLQDTLEQTLRAVQELLPERIPNLCPDRVVHDVLLRFLAAVGEQPQRWRLVLLPSPGAPAGIRAGVERNRAAVLERALPWFDGACVSSGSPEPIRLWSPRYSWLPRRTWHAWRSNARSGTRRRVSPTRPGR